MTRRKKIELTHPNYPGALGKIDRQGKIAWQYGRGGNSFHIPGEPGDPEFIERYEWLTTAKREEANKLEALRQSFHTSRLYSGLSYPPRGLSRYEAARYIGVGPTFFDQLIAQQKMPASKNLDGYAVWDRVELDIAFSAFERGAESEIDARLREWRAMKI